MGNSSSGHVCHSPQQASSPVYVSSSGASSAGGRCPVTGLAGEVDVHVSTVFPAQQSYSEGPSRSARVILIAPWWISQPWFPHLLRLFVDHPRFFPYRRDLLSLQRYISLAASRTICTHGGSHAALPSSRIFERGL